MEKVELLSSLKLAWSEIKSKQKTITELEKQLVVVDPKTEMTVWDNAKRESNAAGMEYSAIDKVEIEGIQKFARAFFETKHVIDTLAKAEYPVYANAASVGQAIGIYSQHNK